MNLRFYESHLPRDAHGLPLGQLLLGVIAVVALFIGVLATTANPIAIVVGLGAVGGLFLLAAPRMVVWLVLIFGLGTGALMSLAGPGYSKLAWSMSLVSFLLWPVALVHMAQHKRIPAFIWLALCFVVVCVMSTALHLYSISELAAGFKRYFQAYGLMFALAALAFTADDMRRWQKLVLGLALLQLPFALYELFFLVPLRGGLAAGSEATDVVAGSFGANLNGGSANAEMAAFLVIVLIFLLARRRARLLGGAAALLLGLLCVVPLGLGETKVVVLLLPLAGAVVMRKDLFKSPLRYLPALLTLALVTVALAWIYVVIMNRSTFSAIFDNSLGYNVGTMGYGDAILNRSTTISFWSERHGWSDPVGFLFGHGIGSSYWSSDNPVSGHIGMRYPKYGIDLTTMSTLLWDTGLVGFMLYVAILLAAWIAANRVWRMAQEPAARADALAIQGALAIFAVFTVYSNSPVNLQAFQIVIAAVLGYLAFLYRTHCVVPDSKPKRKSHYYR